MGGRGFGVLGWGLLWLVVYGLWLLGGSKGAGNGMWYLLELVRWSWTSCGGVTGGNDHWASLRHMGRYDPIFLSVISDFRTYSSAFGRFLVSSLCYHDIWDGRYEAGHHRHVQRV